MIARPWAGVHSFAEQYLISFQPLIWPAASINEVRSEKDLRESSRGKSGVGHLPGLFAVETHRQLISESGRDPGLVMLGTSDLGLQTRSHLWLLKQKRSLNKEMPGCTGRWRQGLLESCTGLATAVAPCPAFCLAQPGVLLGLPDARTSQDCVVGKGVN